jgi:AraC-like DNA-binding protein
MRCLTHGIRPVGYHLGTEPPLNAVEQRFSINPYYFSIQFEEVTDTNYVSYLQMYRRRQAWKPASATH